MDAPSDPERGEEANPFAAPAPAPQRVIVLPGWVVLMFSVTAVLIPCTVDSRHPESWVPALVYGLPGAVAGVVFAISNLRVGVHQKLSRIALVLTAGALVATVLRLIPLVR